MQATNKSDATQVYEGAERATRVGIKDFFKYILKPFSVFSYHYFVEGIKAVQKDGPTKELEKITNLSYDETIRVMEKCQKDGIRVVASERKLSTENTEFGKKKSLFQQKRITKYPQFLRVFILILSAVNSFVCNTGSNSCQKVYNNSGKSYF